MYSHREEKKRVHVVDLDPYGTAAPFIDAAVQAVEDGGKSTVPSQSSCVHRSIQVSCALLVPTCQFSVQLTIPRNGVFNEVPILCTRLNNLFSVSPIMVAYQSSQSTAMNRYVNRAG